MTYEIMFDEDYIVCVDEDGNEEIETVTRTDYFTGTHLELRNVIKEMYKYGFYNITAEPLYDDDYYC